MITTQDKELLAKKGITEAQIAEQLACFQTGFPFLKLDAAASIEKGILAPDAEEQKEIAAIFNTHLKYGLSSEDEDKALSDVVRKVKLASIEDEMVHTSDIMRWQELLSLKNKMQKFSINRV